MVKNNIFNIPAFMIFIDAVKKERKCSLMTIKNGYGLTYAYLHRLMKEMINKELIFIADSKNPKLYELTEKGRRLHNNIKGIFDILEIETKGEVKEDDDSNNKNI